MGALALLHLGVLNTAALESVPFVEIQARQVDHVGEKKNANDCIAYGPRDTGNPNASQWVGPSGEALTSHGCPATSDPRQRSALGFVPSALPSLPLGETFNLGEIRHYNNPVSVSSREFRGELQLRLVGTSDVVFSFPWFMDETPNSCDTRKDPDCSDDLVRFEVQSPDTEIDIDGIPYRMVVLGFGDCRSGSNTRNEWHTPESATATSCLWGSLSQVRQLTVSVDAEAPDGWSVPSAYDVSSTTNLAGDKNWSDKSNVLAPGSAWSAPVVAPGQEVTFSSEVPNGWEAPTLSCTGSGVEVDGMTVRAGAVGTGADLGIDCTISTRAKVEPLKVVNKSVTDLGYTQRFEWDITNSVDPSYEEGVSHPSGTEFRYSVNVERSAGNRVNGTYSTHVTIENPNAGPIKGVSINDPNCRVPDPFDIDPMTAVTIGYSCLTDAVVDGTSQSRIIWQVGSNSYTADSEEVAFSFDGVQPSSVEHDEVTVTGTFPESGQPVRDSAQFRYRLTHEVPEGECLVIENVASIVETGQSAVSRASVCGPVVEPTEPTVEPEPDPVDPPDEESPVPVPTATKPAPRPTVTVTKPAPRPTVTVTKTLRPKPGPVYKTTTVVIPAPQKTIQVRETVTAEPTPEPSQGLAEEPTPSATVVTPEAVPSHDEQTPRPTEASPSVGPAPGTGTVSLGALLGGLAATAIGAGFVGRGLTRR